MTSWCFMKRPCRVESGSFVQFKETRLENHNFLGFIENCSIYRGFFEIYLGQERDIQKQTKVPDYTPQELFMKLVLIQQIFDSYSQIAIQLNVWSPRILKSSKGTLYFSKSSAGSRLGLRLKCPKSTHPIRHRKKTSLLLIINLFFKNGIFISEIQFP